MLRLKKKSLICSTKELIIRKKHSLKRVAVENVPSSNCQGMDSQAAKHWHIILHQQAQSRVYVIE